MASTIKVQNIAHTGGTNSVALAADGKATFANGVTFNSSVEQSGSTFPQLGMFKLLDTTISSAVATFDITSTHINSTYDEYFLSFYLRPASDNQDIWMRVFRDGAIQTASIYGYEVCSLSSNSYQNSNAQSYMRMNDTSFGSAVGEGVTGALTLQNVNSTIATFCYSGFTQGHSGSTLHNSHAIGGSLTGGYASYVVNGIRLQFHGGGNIAAGRVKLFGIK